MQAKGKTVLYIPTRGKLPGPGQEYTDADAKDKDLVQQLESTLIHWTRQIKEVGGLLFLSALVPCPQGRLRGRVLT